MNILFLTLSKMEDIYQRGIYTDLIRELAGKGMNIYVVSPRPRRDGLSTELSSQGNIHLLRVKTGNITSVKSFVEKNINFNDRGPVFEGYKTASQIAEGI